MAALLVAGITFGFGSGTWLGVIGGLGAGLLVYVLSWRRGTTGYRFILVGIGVAAMFTSVTDFLMARAQIFEWRCTSDRGCGSSNSGTRSHSGSAPGAGRAPRTLVTGVLMATFAVAATGSVLFVAMMAPQIAQRLAGMA